MADPARPGPVPCMKMQRSFYGATYLLDQIRKETGVEADLKACFPSVYKKILSIAYYLILEENNSLSRFSYWERLHIHPFGDDIPSQRSSELFQSIEESERMSFFRKQGKRRLEREYWAFDVTSISSYSEVLQQVKDGRNKEHDHLPQINLALLFGEESSLPFYYRKLPGNITDVTIIRALMGEFDVRGYQKVKIALDRGSYSKKNVNELYKARQKFIIGVKLNLKYVKAVLEEERENLKSWSNHQTQFGVCGLCRTIDWDYEQERPYKGDVLKGKRRAYLLLYYSPEKAARDEIALNDHLAKLQKDLLDGTEDERYAKDYIKYFEVKNTKAGQESNPTQRCHPSKTAQLWVLCFAVQ